MNKDEVLALGIPKWCPEDELTLERERTPEFFEAARALSDFISGLDLSVEQNNNLVHMMCDQVEAAEKGALAQGFKLGMAFKEMQLSDESKAVHLDRGGLPS